MISLIDDAVGRVVDALSKSADREQTIVMFTSDHGDHLGDHRLLLKGAEHYQQIIRVPFIWSDPAGPHGARTDALAQTLDLPTTVLERAAVEPSFGMQGMNLLPVMRSTPGREHVLVQYDHQVGSPGIGPHPRVHTVVDDRRRLTLFHGLDWGELYDLARDPHELHDLWDDPASAAAKSEMLEKLARAEVAAVDRVPMPTGRA